MWLTMFCDSDFEFWKVNKCHREESATLRCDLLAGFLFIAICFAQVEFVISCEEYGTNECR